MTPERKEEIKRDAQEESETIYGNCSANITNIELLDLLAALEEAEKRLERRGKAVSEANKELDWLHTQLAEAQQTISKQREALQSIYEESEDIGARHCAAGALGIEWEGDNQ